MKSNSQIQVKSTKRLLSALAFKLGLARADRQKLFAKSK